MIVISEEELKRLRESQQSQQETIKALEEKLKAYGKSKV